MIVNGLVCMFMPFVNAYGRVYMCMVVCICEWTCVYVNGRACMCMVVCICE